MNNPQRQQPPRSNYVSVPVADLAQFRADNPEARLTSWPWNSNMPMFYGFYVQECVRANGIQSVNNGEEST